MEEKEMLEQTSETENVETETTEEITDEGIELTDTSDADETKETEAEEKTEVKKTLRELLESNPEYQEEFNGMIKGRLARKDREYQRELSKYKDTDNVLRATLKVKDGEDVNQKLRETYELEGVELPKRYEPGLSEREVERLGNGDAEDIIAEGIDAMETEANRLANIGYANLNQREKVTFNRLASELTSRKERSELLKLGAKEELLNDKEFNSFKEQFKSNVPIKDVYELYKGSKPKPKAENPGSMKNTNVTPKNFISEAEYDKMTREEVRSNMELIEKSMEKW